MYIHSVFQNESLEVDVIDNIPKGQTKSSSTLPIIEAKAVFDIVCLFVHTYVYVHYEGMEFAGKL